MGRSRSQTVGYKYFVGVHLAFCHGPIDKITKIKVDDKLLWSGDLSSGSVTVNKEELFGGESREGGISGTFDFLPGGASQTTNSYLTSMLGSLVPAFRGVASLVLRKMYMSMNPYLKVWEVFGQRINVLEDGSPQWEPTLAQIDVIVRDGETDVVVPCLNPAHIIRECLTSRKWGMSYPESEIDDASFLACAQTLKDELMGMCILWDTEKTIDEFNQIILRHINAVIRVNRKTGKYQLKLVRKDYNPATLLVLNPSNAEAVTDFKRSVLGELVNSITVNYHDVIYNKAASLTVQDIALIQDQGGENATTVTYEGFVDDNTASKVAQRDLAALSTPLASCTIIATKVAKDLQMGDAFKLTWPSYNISEMIMRVTAISYGDGRSKKVRIECVQDVFSYPETAFVNRPGTSWVNPSNIPSAPQRQIAFELPYYALVKDNGESSVNSSLDSNIYLGYVGAASSPPTNTGINGQLHTDSGAGYTESDLYDFCPTGTLDGDIGYLTTSFDIANGRLLDSVEPNSWLQIDDELMAVVSLVGSTVTVKRGILDTTPKPHLDGAQVFFWDEFEAIDPTEYVSSDVVDLKLRAVNGSGVSVFGTEMTVNVVGRAGKPYLPGQIAFDTEYYPTTEFATDFTITWSHRNRLLQTGGTLIGFEDSGVTAEPTVEYEIRIYDRESTLLTTYTTSGTSQVVPATVWAGLFEKIIVQIDAKRGSIYSFQTFTYDIMIPITGEATTTGLAIVTTAGDPVTLETL